jgi:hypothetical protein
MMTTLASAHVGNGTVSTYVVGAPTGQIQLIPVNMGITERQTADGTQSLM